MVNTSVKEVEKTKNYFKKIDGVKIEEVTPSMDGRESLMIRFKNRTACINFLNTDEVYVNISLFEGAEIHDIFWIEKEYISNKIKAWFKDSK